MSYSRPKRPKSSTPRRFSFAARAASDRRSRGRHRCPARCRRRAASRARRQGRLDRMDARADPRRPRARSPRSRRTAPRPTGSTAQGVALLDANYPGSAALLNAKARLAGYLARTGQLAAPKGCSARSSIRRPTPAICRRASPTFCSPTSTCCCKKASDPAATAEIFAATQLMVRPGLAQTQAVLARELSGGTDEASRLFRQSVTLTRQIERARIELARLAGSAPSRRPTNMVARARRFARRSSQTQKEQVATQAALGELPALSRRGERA